MPKNVFNPVHMHFRYYSFIERTSTRVMAVNFYDVNSLWFVTYLLSFNTYQIEYICQFQNIALNA